MNQEISRRQSERRLADIGTMIEQYTQQADRLAEEGDYVALGAGLGRLRELRQLLSGLERHVEDKAAELMPTKVVQDDGLYMERRSSTIRKQWDSEGLVGELWSRSQWDITGTQEPTGRAERFLQLILKAVPFTGSLGWRTGALRELGLQIDEWCEETPGRQTVTVRQTQEEPDDR